MSAAPWSWRSCWPAFAGGWLRFFHAPADGRVAALVRVGFALCVLASMAVLYPDLERWFTAGGVLSAADSREVADPLAWSLLWHLPETPRVVTACFWITVAHAVLLLIGLLPRVNAACLYVWLLSWQHRNPLLVDGEDTLMKLLAFYLVFIPSARVWSVQQLFGWLWFAPRTTDSAPANAAPAEPGSIPPRYAIPGWSMRLLQIQMSLMLLATGLGKLQGTTWVDGTALYYAARLDDFFGRFPVPAWPFDEPWSVAGLTWGVLVAELSLPLFVWFRETRRPALVLIVLFHLANEWTMHLFLFHWLMLVGWLSFLDSSDFPRARK
jgi:hypothetical protein